MDFDNEFYKSCIEIASPYPCIVRRTYPSDPYSGAFSDFKGLPSNPRCIYRTGDEWPMNVRREARPVHDHPLQDVWPKLGKQVYEFLDSLNIKWSTIDPVRFADDESKAGPLHLWVGVVPNSLSFEDAKAAAVGCKKILSDAGFPDVEIAFRDSAFTRSTGPQLLNHRDSFLKDSTSGIRSPFTPVLGIQIAPQEDSNASAEGMEGTGALYFRESSQSNRVFLLTARHVALPYHMYPHNKLVDHRPIKKSTERSHGIIHLGPNAYRNALEAMMAKIGRNLIYASAYKGELELLGEAAEGTTEREAALRQKYQDELAESEQTTEDVSAFYSEITRHWDLPDYRVLGYVVYAPPISISTGPKKFTVDWALIDLDLEKIDWNAFQGNVIPLGNISTFDFILKMPRHFKPIIPFGDLLKVEGVVEENEIRKPEHLNAHGEECLVVLKNGRTTGVTFGYATGMESFVREYDQYGTERTSMELAVLPYSCRDGAFSAPGDSGSIVVDGHGRIVGMLIGGSGSADSIDVTYITPYFWLEKLVKQAFPESFLYPNTEWC